jgi:ubiquinone/menaquinone biosynthesis C-methylase UbiE
MAPVEPNRDPEGAERRYLKPYLPHSGERVLDIGCGAGRLTWLFAGGASLVAGLDIDLDELRTAQSTRPEGISAEVCFASAESETIPLSDSTCDLAIFSWSL